MVIPKRVQVLLVLCGLVLLAAFAFSNGYTLGSDLAAKHRAAELHEAT